MASNIHLSHFLCCFQEWLQYQSLWDMEMVNITSGLEKDLSKWEKLLIDIKCVYAVYPDYMQSLNDLVGIHGRLLIQEILKKALDRWKLIIVLCSKRLRTDNPNGHQHISDCH